MAARVVVESICKQCGFEESVFWLSVKRLTPIHDGEDILFEARNRIGWDGCGLLFQKMMREMGRERCTRMLSGPRLRKTPQLGTESHDGALIRHCR